MKIRDSPSDLMVRLGEHDVESRNEPHPHIDIKVKKIIVHPSYQSRVANTKDVALLQVLIFCVKFQGLFCLTLDLSLAEKKIKVKVVILSENSFHFVSCSTCKGLFTN